MTHTYSRGDVVFATPTEVNDNDVPITTTKDGKIGKHPIIVLSADAKSITGVMLQTFNTGTSLPDTKLDAALYKWFLPVSPATKEAIHDPIPAQPGSSGKAQWVNLKDVMTILEKDIVCS
jgi:hypothetical protein